MKISLKKFKGRFEQAQETSSKFENRIMESREYQKEKKIEEKRTEKKGLVRHHQMEQDMHYEVPEGK